MINIKLTPEQLELLKRDTSGDIQWFNIPGHHVAQYGGIRFHAG
jgi:hypothetical protein